VEDFESYRPDVLVLAFDRLEKAQRHYLGLYRLGHAAQRHPHRTVVLCGKDEVRAAYDLCRSEYFDDYVLFWPHTYDVCRLSMSIWMASRDLRAAHSDGMPDRAELFEHARHLQVLEKKLGDQWTDGERRIEAARSSFQQFERDIASTCESYSQSITAGERGDATIARDTCTLAQGIEQLKQRQLEHARRVEATVVDPVSDWALRLKERIEPALAGTRALAKTVREMRPIVMVVDDDELILQLVRRTLDADSYEVIGVNDSVAALRQLSRLRPDVVLMDIRMPGTDGVALTRQLKASPQFKNIPVIIMTGDARREMLTAAMDAGAVEFVVKPFSRASLTSKVEAVLARQPATG
jgi:CheY-like chemotaxis protein